MSRDGDESKDGNQTQNQLARIDEDGVRPETGWYTHQGKREVLSRMTKREMQSSLAVVGNIQKRLYANSRKKTAEGQARLRALQEAKELEKIKKPK